MMMKRHTRPNPAKQIKGGIAEREGSDSRLERQEVGEQVKMAARLRELYQKSVMSGADQGVRLHERHGRAAARQDLDQYRPAAKRPRTPNSSTAR
jgi:hypothetical protein